MSSLPIDGAVYYETRGGFRMSRFRRFLIPLLERIARPGVPLRILDIGGNAQYWEPVAGDLDRLGCEISLLNLDVDRGHIQRGGRFTFLVGDARKTDFPDGAFDLVHSNSVIEHVGGWSDMTRMAGEIRRLAPAYYVQVPSFWFALEPHFRLPLFHWLPEQIRARILMRRACGFVPRAPDMASAMETVQSVQLLDRAQMAALFPDARLEREKVLGLTKSIIAVRPA